MAKEVPRPGVWALPSREGGEQDGWICGKEAEGGDGPVCEGASGRGSADEAPYRPVAPELGGPRRGRRDLIREVVRGQVIRADA